MAAKKPQEPKKSPQELELEKHVDDMMSIEKDRNTDVSKLAEDFNKQAMSAEDVSGRIEVKATSAPELLAEPESEETGPVEDELTKPETKAADIEDQKTDEAVDDIVAKEADTVLAVEDARRKRASVSAVANKDWKAKLKSLAQNKWTWIGVVMILVAVLALPFTRYKVLGLVIKKSVTVTVLDSKTSSPVSGADVKLASAVGVTDEDGQAELSAAVGNHKLLVNKKYYVNYKGSYFVGFGGNKVATAKVIATGRLVPITIINKVTGKPLPGAEIKVQGTTAKTNSKGQAQVALPVKEVSYKGTVKLGGYNDASITVQVTDKNVKENNFGLTPTGQVYFLSNLNGTIDVVKSNLDGSGRKVVLEGTGSEKPADTSLLASRDWRYLVLKARRDTTQPALYLIDTENDKVVPFDNSDSDFQLIGWYGHSFMYSLNRNGVQYWQANKQAVKSYDADHQQLNQLDQALGEGTQDSYLVQTFGNFYILNGLLVYSSQWSGYNMSDSDKTDVVRAIQPNGQNKKDYQTFPSSEVSYIQAALYEPQSIYFEVYSQDGGKTSFYEFENQAVKQATGVDQSSFDREYPTYLVSPSGSKTFWTELRDGKNALFVGNANASSKKQIASLSTYSPYGWYGDNYVLVSKNDSELYIMSPNNPNEPPLKVTDYYKPTQIYKGYGYGYGGL